MKKIKKAKKVKKFVEAGQAHIQATFNNTIISIADENGNVKLDDYHDTTSSSPISLWSGHPTTDDMRKQK